MNQQRQCSLRSGQRRVRCLLVCAQHLRGLQVGDADDAARSDARGVEGSDSGGIMSGREAGRRAGRGCSSSRRSGPKIDYLLGR